MNRLFGRGALLVVLGLAGIAAAQAQTSVTHEVDFVSDGASALYDVFDTVSSASPVTFTVTPTVLGDATSFAWEANGGLTVNSLTGATANLTLNGTGTSHYSYASNPGQGLFDVQTVGGNTVLSLSSYESSIYGAPTSTSTINALLSGNWTVNGVGPLQVNAASFIPAGNWTVTKYFVYDSSLDVTSFQAVSGPNAGSPVPEPSAYSGVAVYALGTLGVFALGLRRRASRK